LNKPVRDKIWSVIEIINWGDNYFKRKGFEKPRYEIEWLLQDLLGLKKLDLYLQFDKKIPTSKIKKLKSWIQRRINREPLQYITNKSEFYGREFFVNQKVLIPRPETELLIEIALDTLKDKEGLYIIDVGSGCGCIGITLGAELVNSMILSLDISKDALSIAKQNAEFYKLDNIQFLELDFLKSEINQEADLIISNPPYISKKDFKNLMIDVKDYEPKVSLTDFDDGLVFYKRFAEILPKILKKNGLAIIELSNGNHPDIVLELFTKCGYKNIQTRNDLNGDKRAIILKV